MIICIMGYTCSGKSTLIKPLSKKLNMPIAVSYTSRHKREKEIEGVDYHFVNNKFFKNNKDQFIEFRDYKVATGETWYYGYHVNSFENFENTDYLCIIESKGYYKLCEYFGKSNIVPIFISAPLKDIYSRLSNRGDNYEEAQRRVKADINDFSYFLKNEQYYGIDNSNKISQNKLQNEIFDLITQILK